MKTLAAVLPEQSPANRLLTGALEIWKDQAHRVTAVEAALGLPKIHDTALQRREKIGKARWDRVPTFSIVLECRI
ncbi:MAG: hypothetical protein HRU31_16320 [Rhodobacteraceae bacterium]|nr:hypothetical protein [Paracoccaceae bacterium]